MNKFFKLLTISALSVQTLSAANETANLNQIQDYLNRTRSMEANFEQLSPNGELRTGLFELFKPGKLRLKYNKSKESIFSDNGVMYFYNGSTKDLTQTQLDQTVADILISEFVMLDTPDIKIKKFEDDGVKVTLELSKANMEDAGSITLVFSKNPLKLVQWKVIDAQNQKTVVLLKNLKENTLKNLETDPGVIMGQ